MRAFVIQVFRGGEWRKVSTVTYGTSRWSDPAKARKQGLISAFIGLAQWQASDQFAGAPLRVAEAIGLYGNLYQPVGGIDG